MPSPSVVISNEREKSSVARPCFIKSHTPSLHATPLSKRGIIRGTEQSVAHSVRRRTYDESGMRSITRVCPIAREDVAVAVVYVLALCYALRRDYKAACTFWDGIWTNFCTFLDGMKENDIDKVNDINRVNDIDFVNDILSSFELWIFIHNCA